MKQAVGPHGQYEFVWDALRNVQTEFKIARLARQAQKSFRALKGKKDLKLHLGSGADIKPGWINIDLAFDRMPQVDAAAQPGTMVINYDLRLKLPLEDNSCAFIYSSHFFEHLEYRHGLKLLRDCHRVLQPGGVFRAAMPNFRGMFEAYINGEYQYTDLVDILLLLPDVEPGTETYTDYLNYGVYQFGEHKCIYDEEKMVLLLQKIGFKSVALSQFEQGIDPDTPLRRRYSFYVEAIK
ncbi:MAG: methyltransferase domain-containing protein [Armatimonadota bacterium]|nr:methyltransferase domain-containing protein [Armatimonadota bacterium]